MADPLESPKPTDALDVGVIAHDMRNALATITMNVTLLKRVTASGDAARIEKHVEVIGRASLKLEALITRLQAVPPR